MTEFGDPLMKPLAISTNGLSRSYESYTKEEGLKNSVRGFFKRQKFERKALLPTTLEIPQGQIVGLVGSNGAGKTTLLKLLSGLIYPTSGSASVLGFTPHLRDYDFLRQMSLLLGQKSQLWWDLPALDSYELLAKIYDLSPTKVLGRARELAQMLRCEQQLSIQLRRLSLGERMKMEVIGSLLHEPKILFLDEPTIGLDIVAQSTIRQFISEYRVSHNPTIILTSHYMDDISLLADRLLLMSQGQIVYDGDVKSFTEKAQKLQRLKIRFTGPIERDVQISPEINFRKGEDYFEFEVEQKEIGAILSRISLAGSVLTVNTEESDFEEVIREFLEKDLGSSKTRSPLTI